MPDDEEVLQLRADAERYKRMLRQKDEMIEEMEHELCSKENRSIPNDKSEAREKDLNGRIRDLLFEMDSKDLTIGEQNGVINELREEIGKLEKSNRELLNRSDFQESDDSNSFLEGEMVRISEECEKYKGIATTCHEQILELQKEAVNKQEEHETAIEHVKNLECHLKTREEEIARLEGEVFDLKNSSQGKHASSGNSIFAEAMDAERRLEEDLKKVFREKQALMALVKRLTLEKEEAEERARSFMNRGLIVRNAINHIDVEEMRRLRARVQELETERTQLWERLFIKMRTVPKRDIGPIIVGYFESFKCSIASVTGGHAELLKKNEKYVTMIRGMQQEIENQRVQIEQLQFDHECLERKLRSAAKAEVDEHPQLRAPLKPVDNSRPSFFVKTKKPAAETSLVTSMNNMQVTPQKPSLIPTTSSTTKTEEGSEWAMRRLKAKADKKAATPTVRYNYVTLSNPTPRFKPPLLQRPPSPPNLNED